MALLTGCASGGAGTEGNCAAFRPIHISRADALSDGIAKQILAHNRTGATLCGW